jgi:MoxR-like ATPase
VNQIDQIVSVEELLDVQEAIKSVYADELIKEYIVSLVDASRHHPDVYLGASPRGSLALFKASQARAAILGRDYVIPDDVKALAEPTLAHRLIISPAARIKNVDPREVVQELLASVPVPGARVKTTKDK